MQTMKKTSLISAVAAAAVFVGTVWLGAQAPQAPPPVSGAQVPPAQPGAAAARGRGAGGLLRMN